PIIEKEANPHKKMRFYLAAKKFDKAQELLDKVANKKTFGSFIKLYSSLLALEQSANFDEELRTNATLLQKITELADATDDSYEKSFAKTILKRAGLRNDLETIEMINLSSARLMNHNEETQNSTFITQHSIAVFPNPTSGEVNITHNLNLENGKVNFKVYNMLGVEVLNENLTSTNNQVQLNNLKSGVYFYTITQNNQTIKTDKLMVK
ncbi:MAG TPA: T9SS type A sorting domain-containing protein, partial [Vicingus sp.]|nr:T9SS type A sorting domain-containing protein [Vicingus sp.]